MSEKTADATVSCLVDEANWATIELEKLNEKLEEALTEVAYILSLT